MIMRERESRFCRSQTQIVGDCQRERSERKRNEGWWRKEGQQLPRGRCQLPAQAVKLSSSFFAAAIAKSPCEASTVDYGA